MSDETPVVGNCDAGSAVPGQLDLSHYQPTFTETFSFTRRLFTSTRATAIYTI